MAIITLAMLGEDAFAQTPLSTIEAESGLMNVQSDGTFTFDGESGGISGGTDGRFTFTVGGALVIPFDAAVGGDVLVGRLHVDEDPMD